MLAKDKPASIATRHSSVLGFTAHSIRPRPLSVRGMHQKVAHNFRVCSIMMQAAAYARSQVVDPYTHRTGTGMAH